MRGTPFLYPTLESIHIVGIALLIGPAFAFDLRLLGVGRRLVSVTTAARSLLPVSHVGLAVALLTGVALFSAQTTVVAGSAAAPWKLGLLLVAGLNVLVFHRGAYRRVEDWAEASPPPAALVAAGLSLIAWTGVVFAGRFLAYT
ncbi:hypothetical protein MT355_15185 [Rathayibacter sp. VKM Ac-2929]|uniref:hypothetical protein n=1 Tax=Rathayibacter sp. VKM Ac-2929 TaxID=2929480 RepID=UPI001FB5480E|nr:hypothetical protein [Rathayibacter sp. VKM Ac-2929]MCJ1674602.1 hypothetical protein [Rathayibacter sp. VKM Ac-2929]MCJ1684883.1 hypothetical protein [Rathayibacter sp. VKM Ac-2928]